MKADKKKLELALARACLTPSMVAEISGIPRPTLNNVISGRNVRPATLGRVADALGVDVLEIMEVVKT